MTDPPDAPDVYRPDRRTAVVLSGAGTAGAYHAGALRALREAGVRVDVVAGRGVGAVGAVFAAIDGTSSLWESSGLWRRPVVAQFYRWRRALRLMGLSLAGASVLLLVPPLVAGLGLGVLAVAPVFDAAGAGTAAGAAEGTRAAVARLFAPDALPTRLPQLVAALLLVAVGAFAVGAWRTLRGGGARAPRDGFWWSLLGAPLSTREVRDAVVGGLWDLLRGGAPVRRPEARDLSRRAAELLGENLGQPGFRELLLVVHDLDARRDLALALLAEPWRQAFFAGRGADGTRRSIEAVDLAGAARDHLLDAVTGGLALPVVTDPAVVRFAPESAWRGEAHRVCDRPEGLLRTIEEAALAGARQLVLVTAVPEAEGPHALTPRRASPRARASEYLHAAETAAVRDAVAAARGWFDALFVVRPAHNPVGPLDGGGAWDDRSARWHTVSELVDRGYEDAYRQFVDPVVGGSGEGIA